MAVLSIIIPCYNSEVYIDRCVKSVLSFNKNIEIVLVNDGSTDSTPQLLDAYKESYPDTIEVIHQNNKGHGGAINAGIQKATGMYIKIIDSDDWVDSEALKMVADKLYTLNEKNQKIDMLITNFVYDKVGTKKKKLMHYNSILPLDCPFEWDQVNLFPVGKYILMHSVIYNKAVLATSNLKLPEHTFYVDNLYVYLPLSEVKTLYYMNVSLYHYFIGRDDQSVNEKVMMSRINQQIKVNYIMLENTDLSKVNNKKKRMYIIHYLNIVTTITSVLLTKIGTPSALNEKKLLWKSIKRHNLSVFWKMKFSLLGCLSNLPGKYGQKTTLFVYKKVQSIFGFN